MPSSILNSDDGVISGTAGLKNSGGDDAVLLIQTKGVTAATVSASQVFDFVNPPTGIPSASPGGSTTQVQFNNAGAFGGISGVTTDGTRMTASTTIGVGGATPSTSGSGISFPATQSASTNANTLDDYEEGTWTPLYVPETNSFTSITMHPATGGVYTKIGDTVFVNCQMLVSSMTIGSASGSVRISGFPFAAQASTGSANLFAVTQTEQWNTQNPCTFSIGGNVTSGALQKRTAADGATSALNVNQMGTSNANYAFFAGSYKVA